MTSAAIISRCVQRCADAKDGRGRWRMDRETSAALVQAGSTPTIAAMTAQAAAAVGAWIHERAGEVARELALCALWDAAA